MTKDYAPGKNIKYLKMPSDLFLTIIKFLLNALYAAIEKSKCGTDVTKNLKKNLVTN